MIRLGVSIYFVFLAILVWGQKKNASFGADDIIIGNQKVTPLIAKKNSNNISKTVKRSDYFAVADAVLKAIVLNAPNTLILDLDIKGIKQELLLKKKNIVSDYYTLRTSSGILETRDIGILTYQGKVLHSNRNVVLTISDQKMYFIVSSERGNYEIHPKNDEYVGYFVDDLVESKKWICETEEDRSGNVSEVATIRSGDCVELYLECDFTSFTDNGSDLLSTEAWVVNMMNSVDMLYDDIDIPLVVSEIFIWDTPDPYQSANTLTTVRDAFMDEIQDDYNGRIAKLLSTRPIGGGLSNGIGGLCGSYGDFPGPYAVSTDLDPNLTEFPSYSYNIFVLAHEIGHVLGARHTHACVWNANDTQIDDCGNVYANDNGGTPEGLLCFDENAPILPVSGTIMSNCNLLPSTGIDFANGFHPLVAEELSNNYINADCYTGEICATESPSNDNCLGAIELTVYDVCNPGLYDNYLSTTSGILPPMGCGNVGEVIDVWFTVKVPDSGTLSIETTNGGSLDDLVMQVYTGDCENLVRLECDDNNGMNNHALLNLTGLTPCDYLYIRIVDSQSDEEGTFGLCAYDVSASCHPDFDALVDIYNLSFGSSWTNNSGWSEGVLGNDCDICNWFGVVCDGFGRVKEINLGNNNLSGKLSPMIGELKRIQKINLFTHNLENIIPDVFDDLIKLKYLDLSGGDFTGEIPNFTGLNELEILYLESNMLTGELPSAIGDLPNINIFWIKNNNLSGCIPVNYVNLCNIQSVQMHNNESLPSDGDFSQFCDNGLGVDDDGDGFCSGIDIDDDCNDDSNVSYPGAAEICDGVDNNCDGTIDEGFVEVNTWLGGDSQWNINSNWSLGHIPLACEDVIITDGNITLGTNDAVARSLTITDSGYLNLLGALYIQGSDGTSFISEEGSTADISGSLEIYSLVGNAVSISGNISNSGTVIITHPINLIHMKVLDVGSWTNEGLGTVSLLLE